MVACRVAHGGGLLARRHVLQREGVHFDRRQRRLLHCARSRPAVPPHVNVLVLSNFRDRVHEEAAPPAVVHPRELEALLAWAAKNPRFIRKSTRR